MLDKLLATKQVGNIAEANQWFLFHDLTFLKLVHVQKISWQVTWQDFYSLNVIPEQSNDSNEWKSAVKHMKLNLNE